MKQSKTTKRLLAVMMSFLMAFSSVQGYIKAEDLNQPANEDAADQIIENVEDEVDPGFSVDPNEEMDSDSETDKDTETDDEIDADTKPSDDATDSDAVEDATKSDTADDATNGDATPSDAEQIINPDMDYEWEDVDGAQINGLMSYLFFYRTAALPTTGEGVDVSSEIKVVSSKATIDGKKITEGADFDINTSSAFAFDFEWMAKEPAKTFNPGDTMTINIGTIKGLDPKIAVDSKELYISGVKVGSYSLTYATDGKLEFHITFSDYIGYFQNISGYFKGSAKFSKLEEGTSEVIEFMDSASASITVKPIVPDNSGEGAGKGWSPTVPNDYNYNEKPSLKKGVKWIDPKAYGTNNIEYRVGFFDLIKEYEKAEPFNGNVYDDVILMDELDGNQSYQLYAGGAPFFIEVPIFYYGTNNSIGYQGTGGSEEVKFGSDVQSKSQPGISASIINITSDNFTQISDGDIEAQVRNTSRSWGIIKNGTSEKLIVNVGKLGSSNPSEAITMTDINEGWKLDEIYNKLLAKIKTAEEHIKNYKDDSYSPKQNLLKRLDDFMKMELPKEIELPEGYDAKVNEFKEAILAYISEGNTDVKAPELDSNVVEIIKGKDEYKNLINSLNNYRNDAKVYEDNKDLYIAKWQNRIDIYNKTIEYYVPTDKTGLNKVNAPIHGFIIKYTTKVTNLSQETVSNNVTVSTGSTTYESSITVKHNFKAGIKGNYVNGDVVLVKADSRYGYTEEDLASSTVKGMQGVQFQVFEKGSTTPLKFMKAELNKDKHYVYIPGYHDSYENFTDTLTTDSKGTIALSSLLPGEYYFKEVSAVEGYYGKQNQNIEFEVNKDQVTYKLAENVSRAITLKKVDAETKKGLEGVTFKIYKDDKTELTGFTKDGDVYLYNGEENKNSELKTNKDGVLEVRNLPSGSYYMKETAALDGYKPLEDAANYFPFVLSENLPENGGAIIEIYDGKAILNFKEEVPEVKASLKVIKKGSDGILLAGVQFELHLASDKSLIGTYTTNADGEIMIDDLSIGSYYLVEIKGADGYDFDSTKTYPVAINGEEELVEKVIINPKKVIPPNPTPTPDPDPTPDPSPVDPDRPVDPDKPEVDIPDEEVPLGPGEDIVEIEEEDVPLSDGGDNAFVEIEDEDVPLGPGVPNTGDGLYFWIPTMLISMLALGVLIGLRRRLSK